jgi:hypothetical protein
MRRVSTTAVAASMFCACGGARQPDPARPKTQAELCNAAPQFVAANTLASLGPEFISAAPPLEGLPNPEALERPALLATRPGLALLAINPSEYPNKVGVPAECVGPSGSASSVVRVCVSDAGTVTSVAVLKPSIAIIDQRLPGVIGNWRFKPYLIEGQPVPFCFPMTYSARRP